MDRARTRRESRDYMISPTNESFYHPKRTIEADSIIVRRDLKKLQCADSVLQYLQSATVHLSPLISNQFSRLIPASPIRYFDGEDGIVFPKDIDT